MPRYRWTTAPTGARKGEWLETRRQAKEDVVKHGLGSRGDYPPFTIYLDYAVEIEEDAQSKPAS